MYNADHIQHAQLTQSYRSGTKWFYWIAALSLVTSAISLFGGGWRFILSLGTTQVIDGLAIGLATELGEATKIIAGVLDIFVTGFFFGMGWLAGKKYLWAYILGMVAFLFDGALLLIAADWIGVIFHALVLFWMFRGFQAGRELVALERQMAQNAQAAAEPATQPTF